jgi:hypothetical protein
VSEGKRRGLSLEGWDGALLAEYDAENDDGGTDGGSWIERLSDPALIDRVPPGPGTDVTPIGWNRSPFGVPSCVIASVDGYWARVCGGTYP